MLYQAASTAFGNEPHVSDGTPLGTLLSLTMKRAEFTGSGPFAAFARKVCGISIEADAATEYTTTADYARAQDTGRRAAAE